MVGINKGQVLFGIVTVVGAIYFTFLDTTLRFISLGWILTLIILSLGFIGFFVLLINLTTRTGVSISYRSPPEQLQLVRIKKDPSHISRVVSDPNSNEEYIISGEPNLTFRAACLTDWSFKHIPRSGNWIIKDERGNDISNTRLVDYDSVAIMDYRKPEEPSIEEYRKKLDDRSDEYTSIDQGVTFYD